MALQTWYTWRIWLSWSCVPWFLGYRWLFIKHTQSLETRVHMTNLTRSNHPINRSDWNSITFQINSREQFPSRLLKPFPIYFCTKNALSFLYVDCTGSSCWQSVWPDHRTVFSSQTSTNSTNSSSKIRMPFFNDAFFDITFYYDADLQKI